MLGGMDSLPLDHALTYAARGWPVLPLHTPLDAGCSCRRADCRSIGKHPRTPCGLLDATTDPAVIRRWWTQWPEANIGIETEGAGLVVVDVDPDHGGEQSWNRLLRDHGPALHATLRVRTGTGMHLYFRAPDEPIRSGVGILGPGLDIRAAGGYVVAPPSRHVSGAAYRVETPAGEAPAPLPSALRRRLAGSRSASMSAPDVVPGRARPDAEDTIPEGQRNAALFRLGGKLRRDGLGEEAILAALSAENARRCRPPLGASEIRAIARGLARYPSGEEQDLPWPVLAPEALYGLAGEIVDAIAPHTESDPVALLVNTLVAFGNVVGRTAHARAEGSRHPLNLYAVTVARSAKGRKGTAWSRVREIFERIDAGWATSCLSSGLASGEGLIAAVRDSVQGADGELRDAGVSDKRLLVVEEEFAGTLKIATRDGNTLSAILRQAWDRGELRVMTRTNPLRASGAHVSILGHVTQEELLRYLNLTEYGNGFANRFLWICARRARLLPDGGGTPDLSGIVPRLSEAVRFARAWQEPVQRDEAARELWHEVYPALSGERDGLIGAVTGRAEAQCLRLSVLYAMLDQSPQVRLPHLKAALALWRYADESAAYVFGSRRGDHLADRILTTIGGAGEAGVGRRDIHNALGRNVPADRIDAALDALDRAGRTSRTVESTGGRPKEVFRVR